MSVFSIFRRQTNDVERKDSRAAIDGMSSLVSPNWSVKSYASRLQSGYRQNPVGYRCVRMIAEACASLPVVLNELGQRKDHHAILDLLASPNHYETGSEFLERCYSFLLLHGNSYVEQVVSDDVSVLSDLNAQDHPSELHVLRPDRVRIIAGSQGWPIAYEYRVNDRVTRFEHGRVSSPLLHLKSFHPTDDHYGLSPMEAASQAVEIHNSANGWNKSLFDNAARPSGALVYRGTEGATHLTDEQFTRLKKELEENFQGYQNAGRPLLLEGGLDWSSISLPFVMGNSRALNIAGRLLQEVWDEQKRLELAVSWRHADLEPTDIIRFRGEYWRIVAIRYDKIITLDTVSYAPWLYQYSADMPMADVEFEEVDRAEQVIAVYRPEVILVDLPSGWPAQPSSVTWPAGVPVMAAIGDPFPTDLIAEDISQSWQVRLAKASAIGETRSVFESAASGVWIDSVAFELELFSGELESRSPVNVLAGANVLAVETELGWEVIQFKNAELIGVNRYKISGVLRGQAGSDAGRQVVIMPWWLHLMPVRVVCLSIENWAHCHCKKLI